jgi:hypothetical protein
VRATRLVRVAGSSSVAVTSTAPAACGRSSSSAKLPSVGGERTSAGAAHDDGARRRRSVGSTHAASPRPRHRRDRARGPLGQSARRHSECRRGGHEEHEVRGERPGSEHGQHPGTSDDRQALPLSEDESEPSSAHSPRKAARRRAPATRRGARPPTHPFAAGRAAVALHARAQRVRGRSGALPAAAASAAARPSSSAERGDATACRAVDVGALGLHPGGVERPAASAWRRSFSRAPAGQCDEERVGAGSVRSRKVLRGLRSRPCRAMGEVEEHAAGREVVECCLAPRFRPRATRPDAREVLEPARCQRGVAASWLSVDHPSMAARMADP